MFHVWSRHVKKRADPVESGLWDITVNSKNCSHHSGHVHGRGQSCTPTGFFNLKERKHLTVVSWPSMYKSLGISQGYPYNTAALGGGVNVTLRKKRPHPAEQRWTEL